MKQSDIDEALVALYLRLNGYFTSGFIVHSPILGQSTTEVDCLAIRLPHHAEPDRMIGDDPFLDTRQEITDLLICEVKSDPNLLAFNKPVKTDVGALTSILNWAGTFDAAKAAEVAGKLAAMFDEKLPLDVARRGLTDGNVRIRALLCCPPMTEQGDDMWCLTGSTILGYAEACFRPEASRPSCSVRYNFQQWGFPMKQIVTWLKDKKRKGLPTWPACMRNLNGNDPSQEILANRILQEYIRRRRFP